MKRVVRGTLAWKLYAIGLVQLALLAGVFMGVGRLVMGAPPDHQGPPGDPGPPDGYGPPPSPQPGAPHARPAPVIGAAETLFVGGFIIIGIGSLLTARWIVKPLEDLARVAKALGGGDLRARSGLDRSDELGELARTFDEMGDRIERLLLAEKELLANVSHELRTPLARIRVALDIAGESDLETGRMSLNEIGTDLGELETIVNDILIATRLEIARGAPEAARFELRREDVACDTLCERAAGRFRAKHEKRPLVVELDGSLPRFQGDPALFRRVLDNLLENAHKYSPDPATSIALRVRHAGGEIAFEVADQGMGIAERDLPHLFEPFFRSDRSRARGAGGVGLGLTLAKRIVDAHHGTMTVTSTAGVGTTFRVVVHCSS